MIATTSGIHFNYHHISGVIESIVYMEWMRVKIPGYEYEDVAQEIRMKCIREMHQFDPSRIGPSPYRFFKTIAKNHLYNLRRGYIVPNNPPCVRCELWNNKNKTCLIDEIGCDRILKYREKMTIKNAIKQPNVIQNDITGNTSTEAITLDMDIRVILPHELLLSYEAMLSGEEIPLGDKIRIRKIVKEYLNN